MLETAIEVTDGRIPASDLNVILGWGKRMLQQPIELLDGVRETLIEVSRTHSILLITKGDLFDQESKLARSGLGELFQGVEILSEKNREAYQLVLDRRGIEPDEFVMVGNSLRSDILPVVELGAVAVHIPYHLTWRHEHVEDHEMPTGVWHRLEQIGELEGLLAELQSRSDRKKKRASGPL